MKHIVMVLALLCVMLSTTDWKSYGADTGYSIAGDYSGSIINEKLGSTN